MRRLEGTRLQPVIDDKAVRRAKASDVERLAKETQAEQRSPRNAQQVLVRAAELQGRARALVFERLEQRYSPSEIVIALRVPPEDVRDRYQLALVGLWADEPQRKEPALPRGIPIEKRPVGDAGRARAATRGASGCVAR